MLINHKNFHFTQIPDKTNDRIFLKSSKTIFDYFLVTFAQWVIFPKIQAVTHNYSWVPNTMLSFRKNSILRKLADRWKDEGKDRQTHILLDPSSQGCGSKKKV